MSWFTKTTPAHQIPFVVITSKNGTATLVLQTEDGELFQVAIKPYKIPKVEPHAR